MKTKDLMLSRSTPNKKSLSNSIRKKLYFALSVQYFLALKDPRSTLSMASLTRNLRSILHWKFEIAALLFSLTISVFLINSF